MSLLDLFSGSLMALTGMVLGFTSLFIDQYDLNFSPEGIAKDVADVTWNFQQAVRPVTTTLKTVSSTFICNKFLDFFKGCFSTGTDLFMFYTIGIGFTIDKLYNF